MAFFIFRVKILNRLQMKKIIYKEILPNGVVILTMNNPEVNNNVT